MPASTKNSAATRLAEPETDRLFKSNKELRKFGLVMFVPLAIIAGLLFWQRGLAPQTYGVGGAALFFLISGLLFPALLGPIEWVWMKFAGLLSFVMTRVILTLMFFLAMTPMGLLMRLVGRDPLQLKHNPAAKSYWAAVEEDGPGTRSTTPF